MVVDLRKSWPDPSTSVTCVACFVPSALLLVFLCGDLFDVVGTSAVAPFTQLIGLGTLLVVLVLARFSAGRFLSVEPRVLFYSGSGIVVLSAFLFLAGGFLDAHGVPYAVAAVAFGVGEALWLMGSAQRLLSISRDKTPVAVSLLFLIFTMLALVLGYLDHVGRFFAVLLVVLLSCGAFFTLGANEDAPCDVDVEESRRNLKLNRYSMFSYACSSALMTFSLGACTMLWSVERTLLMMVVASIVAILVCMVTFVIAGNHLVLQSPVERFSYPVAVMLLIALPFADERVLPLVFLLMLAIAVAREFARLVNLLMLANEFEIQPIFLRVQTFIPVVLGYAAGNALALLFARFDGYFLFVGSAFFLILLSVATVFAPYGQDVLTIDHVNDVEGTEQKEFGLWGRACDRIACQYHLTERESEVMHILGRGRSAGIIARELVISTNTAKSHISNIYRKMEVSGQQELIDVVACCRDSMQHMPDTRGHEAVSDVVMGSRRDFDDVPDLQ